MKTNKIFAVLSLSLVGVFGLASCAPAVVTPEEGKQTLNAMKKAYEEDKVADATAVHASYALASDTTILEKLTTVGTGYDIMIDTKNTSSYSRILFEKKVAGKKEVEKKEYEFWAYYDNGNFVTALKGEQAKIYSSVAVDGEAIKNKFDDSYFVSFMDSFINENGIEMAIMGINDHEDKTEVDYKNQYGSTASVSINSEYRSNLEDVLQYNYSAKISGASAFAQVGGNAEANLNIAISDYRLTEMSMESNFSATIGKNEYINNTTQSLIIDYSAKITKPNIDEFTKGVIVMPENPFNA